ncbi:hypothetical protein [Halohasta litorea]|uniref:Competence protein CoiA-like family protein n=1 Tax=Halohasta litorea TaxID=869891 RepID=A0ABD6DBP8_9EURY|nr:hypothetical protein [Halohasta litorea]
MYPRSAPGRARHFYHVSDSNGHRCSNGGGESEAHEHAVARVEVALDQRFGDDDNATIGTEVDVDVSGIPTPTEVRRADALVEFDDENVFFGAGLAVEVQHKHEDKDTRQATHDYLAAGYSVVWIGADAVLNETFDYDTIGDEFERDDGNGYAYRTSEAELFVTCGGIYYQGEHLWRRVPEYAHPRGQEDLPTYDICIGQQCDLRRLHQDNPADDVPKYTYSKSDEHGPDFPLKAVRKALTRQYRTTPFKSWAKQVYPVATVEKFLATRQEIGRCRGPKGIHEWGRTEAIWPEDSSSPDIALHKCRHCPVRLVTNHRGRNSQRTDCLYGREPPHDWDNVYFTSRPDECSHYLYDEAVIEDYCPKCGSTMDGPDTTLLDYF